MDEVPSLAGFTLGVSPSLKQSCLVQFFVSIAESRSRRGRTADGPSDLSHRRRARMASRHSIRDGSPLVPVGPSRVAPVSNRITVTRKTDVVCVLDEQP